MLAVLLNFSVSELSVAVEALQKRVEWYGSECVCRFVTPCLHNLPGPAVNVIFKPVRDILFILFSFHWHGRHAKALLMWVWSS